MLAGFFFGFMSIIEKYLISNCFASIAEFMVAFGLIHVIRAAVLFSLILNSDASINTGGIIWASIAGAAVVLTAISYFYALAREDASRIAPVLAVVPAFTIIFAALLFGHIPTYLQISGLIIASSGIFVIAIKPIHGRLYFARKIPLLAALVSSFFAAWVMIGLDQASAHVSVLTSEAFRTLAVSLVIPIVFFRKKHFAGVYKSLRNYKTLILFFLAEGVFALGFMLLVNYAVSVGPVGPVGILLTSISPVTVLIIASVLSTQRLRIFEEVLNRETLSYKILGTLLVISGVVVLRI